MRRRYAPRMPRYAASNSLKRLARTFCVKADARTTLGKGILNPQITEQFIETPIVRSRGAVRRKDISECATRFFEPIVNDDEVLC